MNNDFKDQENNKSDTEYIDINKINENYDQNYHDKHSFAYEFTFNLFLKIIAQVEDKVERNKKFTILNKLFKNIIDNPQEEKYRKLKLSNKNIESLLEVVGVYDFLADLGFQERFIDNELYLFLSDFDAELLNVISSYMNILTVNEEDTNNSVYNDNRNDLPSIEEIDGYDGCDGFININKSISKEENKINQSESKIGRSNNKKKSIVDVLKETKESRVNSNFMPNHSSNWNVYKSLNQSKDIKSVLKETSGVRRNNSDYFASEYGVVPNKNFPTHFNNNISNNNKSNQSNQSRFVTLNDLQYSNPDINSVNVNNRNFKVLEQIGKKCLVLSNEFRRKNGLPALEWDDSIWKISFEHSTNMGIYKVKFGHDGFNERIRKLPFHFQQANENVFMCQGVSEYSVADLGVNGWVNSPGHRKNLLSNTTHCAIATYRNNAGEYFLTQIFIRK